MSSLDGKRALVCAASQGLGKAVALKLAAGGAKVAMCSRTLERVEAAALDIEERTGVRPIAFAADLSKPDDVERLVKQTITQLGGIDVLVTNAGGPPAGRFEEFDDEAWQRAHEQNFLSVVRLIRQVLPGMKAQQSGSIVNIISMSVKQPIPGLILSNAYRSAVVGMAKTLSEEMGPYGIRINNAAPGRIYTERIQHLDKAKAENAGVAMEEVAKAAESAIPLGRSGKPEEFASAVAFLCSDEASYLTGVTLQVDGGMVKSLL
ncbi:SDR family NAD(P)-dependent oxidoreductase [Xylanibacillus composti]|uniref:3-oxoacyl-ACP reductase n=1 Tax=Xylanibacillus composti TaxID=1572762 RepID=A0A8J4H1Y4_9BACL|nr:SDR family oxidoreductase [Xylanibacillus composti]MDT9726236.1 SDR family NAD(P)-dependent oxidoreductase [Xylanibacillus composti]GIQ68086.1 3-oxoacyl-ACP reductase [Xylanibacillus composti]